MKTLAERATLYCAAELPLLDGAERDFWAVHLAAFAAEEVARVREAQAPSVERVAQHVGVLCCPRCCNDMQAIHAATRPERPARAKAKSNVIGHPSRCICWRCATPEQNRRALAKAAKKGRRKP